MTKTNLHADSCLINPAKCIIRLIQGWLETISRVTRLQPKHTFVNQANRDASMPIRGLMLECCNASSDVVGQTKMVFPITPKSRRRLLLNYSALWDWLHDQSGSQESGDESVPTRKSVARPLVV